LPAADSGSTQLKLPGKAQASSNINKYFGFGSVLISDFVHPPPCPFMLVQAIPTF